VTLLEDLNLEKIWERVNKGKLDDSNKEILDYLKASDDRKVDTNSSDLKVQN
jgi:hypothetical protein